MKKFVFTLFAVAALIACQSNNKQNQMTGEGEAVEIVGTDSTGLVDVFAYEGTVPTASGKKDSMDYLVIITQKIDSVNGFFTINNKHLLFPVIEIAENIFISLLTSEGLLFCIKVFLDTKHICSKIYQFSHILHRAVATNKSGTVVTEIILC